MRVLMIGAGFAGLGMASRLCQAGFDDFVVLEKSDGVGGTWRANRYPGAACDVESHLYSFSFAPNPDWSRAFAPQAEILAYLERCADSFGVRPKIRFGAEVVSAEFDERRALWRVALASGEQLEAEVLVTGTGGLSRPSLPEIPGLESFAGEAFHSACWPVGESLDGLRVGVIGTGASAIQIVPAIAGHVRELKVFQRTPPWILPKRDRAIGSAEQARFRRFPALQRLARLKQYLHHELYALGFVTEPKILRFAERLAKAHLEQSVADPTLRAELLPRYAMGCKRVLLSNDYYPALQRKNVELVTEPIERVEPAGVRTRDGQLRELDAIVLATGFCAAEPAHPFAIRGLGGRDLGRLWQDGAEAYLGTTVSGFPNFFTIVGPNTGLGHSSMVLMIESQVRYIMDCLELMRSRKLAWVDVKPDVQDRYNRALHARLDRTVWANDCASWYKTKSGKNTTLWPGFTFEFWLKTRRFDPQNYLLEPRRTRDRSEREPAAARDLAEIS